MGQQLCFTPLGGRYDLGPMFLTFVVNAVRKRRGDARVSQDRYLEDIGYGVR